MMVMVMMMMMMMMMMTLMMKKAMQLMHVKLVLINGWRELWR